MRLKTLLTAFAACAVALPGAALAQDPTTGEPQIVVIDQAELRPFPIAIVGFTGQYGDDISNVIRGNLRRSGFFDPLNPAGFTERPGLGARPTFPAWTGIGAQAVLYGGVTPRADGRVDVGLPPVRHLPRVPAGQLPVHRHRRAVAPHRAQDQRRRLPAHDGRERLLRHARDLRRRKRHPA
jgi:Periplasmic component of the Tol biopolymer transport system